MKYQEILRNQQQALLILQDSLRSNKNMLLDFKCVQNFSFDLDLVQDNEERIRKNSNLINKFAYQLSMSIPDNPWFTDINAGKIREIGNGEVDFLLPNLRISDDFLQLIS